MAAHMCALVASPAVVTRCCCLLSHQATITHLESFQLCKEYLDLVAEHPSHARMVKGHVHKLLRGWLSEFTDIRERIQRDGSGGDLTTLRSLVGARGVCWDSAHVCCCGMQLAGREKLLCRGWVLSTTVLLAFLLHCAVLLSSCAGIMWFGLTTSAP